jgi:hypothetical protein
MIDQLKQIEQQKVLNDLAYYTCTNQYHRFSILFKEVLTDGIKYLCDTLQCYWLMDIVGSVQYMPKIKANNSFIVWKIKVNEDKSFNVSAYSDSPFNKENLLYSQDGKYTDFLFNEFEFYQNGEVILLKSEY